MSAIMQQLREDHHHVAFMLSILEQQLERVHEAQTADFELMRDIMVYMTSYPDRIHHPLEDLVFSKLAEHNNGRLEIVDVLLREHQGLAEKGQRFHDMLEQVADGSMVLRAELEETGKDYTAFLRHHMRLEDKEAFPLAERTLQDEDWRWVSEQFEMQKDPVFGSVVEKQFASLFQHIQDEYTPGHP